MGTPQWSASRPRPETFEYVLAQVGRSLDELAVARTDAARQIVALQAGMAELERRIAALDGRFTKILEERFKQAEPDAPTAEIQVRYDLADELRSMFAAVDQLLRSAYVRAYAAQPTDVERAQSLAVFLAGALGPHGRAHIDTDLQQRIDKQTRKAIAETADQIAALRRRAAELDPSHAFVFESGAGALDPALQQAWMHCDPDGDIEFVVTPAYVVGHRVFLYQQVFTSPRQDHPAERQLIPGAH